jgi:hypothetical protein
MQFEIVQVKIAVATLEDAIRFDSGSATKSIVFESFRLGT